MIKESLGATGWWKLMVYRVGKDSYDLYGHQSVDMVAMFSVYNVKCCAGNNCFS